MIIILSMVLIWNNKLMWRHILTERNIKWVLYITYVYRIMILGVLCTYVYTLFEINIVKTQHTCIYVQANIMYTNKYNSKEHIQDITAVYLTV